MSEQKADPAKYLNDTVEKIAMAEAQKLWDEATPDQRAQWEHEFKMKQAAREFERRWSQKVRK